MEKKQKTSLTWQLILTMVVIVAGTVAMCWFFNTTFLEKYYMFHKEKELKSSFDQVRLICEKQGIPVMMRMCSSRESVQTEISICLLQIRTET